MKKLLIVFITSLLYLVLGFFLRVEAAEFNVVIDREYTVTEGGEINVIETHTVTNNSNNFNISKGNKETFQIPIIGNNNSLLERSVDTAVISVGGQTLEIKKTFKERTAELSVDYPKQLERGQSIVFQLTYTNYGLVERSGALYDIYAPGFVEDFQFEQGLTAVSYKTVFKVPSSLPEENFVIPETTAFNQEAGFDIYVFSQESLIGNTIWIQRGRTQYYKFKIIQTAPATDSRNSGFDNEYKVILPRDIDEGEITQKVYYSSISPDPAQVIMDKEGNLVGTFRLPSHEDSQIVLEGFAQVSKKDKQINANNTGTIDEISRELIADYTLPAEFWEVEAQPIQELAGNLKGTQLNVYDIVEKTYKHVINTIDYSEVKRFGINERQGALKTLNGGAAVCMEYSDLFLTLTRAQGIPARAAFGYGYDSRLPENEQEAHQWVEVYMPGIDKWVSVDVTWGEAGPALIGGDLNHFYTHTAGQHPNQPPMVERISYGENVELVAPQFDFSATESIPRMETLTDQAKLLETYPMVNSDNLSNQFGDFIQNIKAVLSGQGSKEQGQFLVNAGISVFGLALVGFIVYLFVSYQQKKQLI